ncbi:MAG: hypothetical protein K6G40_08665 [Eubacterium sp.]|nr:hypothetical protein [Eubacterium sp.]
MNVYALKNNKNMEIAVLEIECIKTVVLEYIEKNPKCQFILEELIYITEFQFFLKAETLDKESHKKIVLDLYEFSLMFPENIFNSGTVQKFI